MSELSDRIQEGIILHIKKVFPQESIGYIKSNHYIEFKNISLVPTERFELSVEDQLLCYRQDVTIVHSHSATVATASKEDIEVNRRSRLKSIIIATDGKKILDSLTLDAIDPIDPGGR